MPQLQIADLPDDRYLTSFSGENGVGIKQQNDATQRFQDELEKERAHANAMQFLSEVRKGKSIVECVVRFCCHGLLNHCLPLMNNTQQKLQTEKRNKMITALGSVFAAFALFFYQHVHPVEAVTLLRQMQQESPMIQSVVTNGRPTVIDFYAEWCENCKEMAPVLREVEGKYKGKVNFVVINGDSATNADLVDRFRVDGIPHLALISKEGEVKTALIGKVPKQVIEADLDSLLIGQKALPYEGYDAFEDEDHFLRF